MQKAALYFAGIFFAAGAVFHVVRWTSGIEITVGNIVVPMWGSIPSAAIAAVLAAWMLIAAQRSQA